MAYFSIMNIVKKIVLVLALLMPFTAIAREDELADILEKCLLREKISPDSIEYNLQLLEEELKDKTGVRRAVYSASLAQLYAMRAYSDVTGQWRIRSVELFREALSNPEALYNARTKDWLPIVKRGKDEKVYGSNMLYVIWRAANDWARDSVMTEQELTDFYASQGNVKPVEVKQELERLMKANDSIWKNAPRLRIRMAEVYYPGDSLRMDIDSANVQRLEWKVCNNRGKLVGKNLLTAPETPGRYTLEVKFRTDAKLNRKPKMMKINFVVSRLQAFVTDMPGKQVRVTVTDAKSGKPLTDAQVLKDKEKRTVRVAMGADSCLPEIRYYERYNYNPPSSKVQPRVAIYTDRAVYRPGQKIMLSAILYSVRHWDGQVREGRECQVCLKDNNNKVLADTTVRSDDFGTLSATLQIPESGELGLYTVSVDGTVRSVRVEEYKRPAFYVEMDKREKDERIPPLKDKSVEKTDTMITVSGRAMNYDGTPLRGGRVTATSRRICCWWWRGGATEDFRHLDTVYTDMEGRFVVQVPVSRETAFRYAPMLRVEVSVLSAQGETQTGSTAVRLFEDPPMETVAMPVKQWLECPVDSFDLNVPARLEFRGREGDERYVFLTAFAGERVVMDTVMMLRDSLFCMELPYKESYADGLRLNAVYVKEGVVHSKSVLLRKRLPDTRLSMHWDTFRDFTQPGATEQWTMRVCDAKGRPVRANVMLALYDASLDAFGANKWMLAMSMYHSLPYSLVRYGTGYDLHGNTYWQDFDVWTHEIKNYDYSQLDMKYFQYRGVSRFRGGVVGTPKPSLGTLNAPSMGNMIIGATDAVAKKETTDLTASDRVEAEEGGHVADDAAFENVELRSDFSETAMFMPQLRTDDNGLVTVSFTMPQSLTTWCLNGIAHTKNLHTGTLTERIVARKALAAKLHLPRFVREKDRLSFTVSLNNTGEAEQKGKMQVQVLDAETDKVLMKKVVSFEVAATSDTVYSFEYVVPKGLNGLKFKAVASASKDSDGEQREIPVISSVVNLTESKAMTLQPGTSEKVKISDMFPAGSVNRRLILEKVEDPVQVAVDALPDVATPRADDVLSYASAYYAASKLGLPDTMLYINKVYTMQKEDGSLPWYDGLAGNVYLTREVGYLLARLGSSNASAQKVMAGIKRYLFAEMEKSIENRKKYDEDWTPWISDLRTLYVLTKDGQADKETLKLVKKVLKRLPDNIDEMDSEYIAIAMIVKHALNEAVLKDGVKVLKERLNHKDGVYLAYRGGAWPSIDRRLHIHTQVMEAWQVVCPEDEATLRGMQRWLLNQKRTQGWKTPIDCIDAVYALTGGDVERYRNKKSSVQKDTVDILRNKYVTVSNDGSAEMWAALYAEYSMPMEMVKDAGMDITIERSFNVKDAKVGDRIKEKVLIDAKRDYEYIVLSVPRAGCAETLSKISGCSWQNGLSYYKQVRDDRTDYFIPALPHGKYIIETEMTVERTGSYTTGVPTVKCCYAEEFRAHGKSEVFEVK